VSTKGLLLDVTPGGVEHRAHVQDDGDTLITSEFQSTRVESHILDDCQRLRGLSHRKGTAFQFAGRVPLVLHQQWKKEFRTQGYANTMTWPAFLAMKLNSRDFSNLRVQDKKL
jgi:hypothetical protein